MGEGCAVVNAVSMLGVEVDMVVVHCCGGPLDVHHFCGGVGVLLQGAFVAPACDVEGFVLVSVGEMDQGHWGWRGFRRGVDHCFLESVGWEVLVMP